MNEIADKALQAGGTETRDQWIMVLCLEEVLMTRWTYPGSDLDGSERSKPGQ